MVMALAIHERFSNHENQQEDILEIRLVTLGDFSSNESSDATRALGLTWQ